MMDVEVFYVLRTRHLRVYINPLIILCFLCQTSLVMQQQVDEFFESSLYEGSSHVRQIACFFVDDRLFLTEIVANVLQRPTNTGHL